MTAILPAPERSRIARPPVGLLLSTGAPKPERGPGRPIDWIRPKEGTLGQFAQEAARYTEVYGDAPKSLNDVYFLVDDVTTVLQIRLTAFSQTGIRAIGQTNYAALPADEFLNRAWDYRDDILFFPKDQSEVRPELRENWEGQPIPGTLDGYDDPRRESVGFKLTASLEFCLPRVMGVGKVARISTSSRNSIRNLYAGLWDSYHFFGNRLVGVPFRLAIRPKPTQRFDREAKKFTSTTVYELVLDTPSTVDEIYAQIKRHRSELGYVDRQVLESRILTSALALPAPDEDAKLRDEPEPEASSDALLNRIARLEGEARAADLNPETVLRGVYGVESALELPAADAEAYAETLDRALPAEYVEGEVIEGSDAEPVPLTGSRSTGDVSGDGAAPESASDQLSGGGPDGLEDEPRAVAPVDEAPTASAVAASSSPPEEPEPYAEIDADAENLAVVSATLIPDGRYKGQRLDEVAVDWLGWALRRDISKWPTGFLTALETYVASREPEVWRKERG